MKLPVWMRGAMFATAAMNLVGAIAFFPMAEALRNAGGLPNDGHPIYRATVGAFVFIFGLAYLWAGIKGEADRLFVAVAAAGKLAFFTLLAWFWSTGSLPLKAVLAGGGDLLFGTTFLIWLFRNRGSGLPDPRS